MTVADVCSNLWIWTAEEKDAEGENAHVYDAVERRPATSRMIERFMMLYGMSKEAGELRMALMALRALRVNIYHTSWLVATSTPRYNVTFVPYIFTKSGRRPPAIGHRAASRQRPFIIHSTMYLGPYSQQFFSLYFDLYLPAVFLSVVGNKAKTGCILGSLRDDFITQPMYLSTM